MSEGCIVITGASGLLGREILKKFLARDSGSKILGIAFSRAGANLVKVDLTDFEATKTFIDKTQPKFLIHAAAQRFPDKMEKDPEKSRQLNVESTRILAEAMKKVNGRLIYISTDYVFDGTCPPYSHDATTNPLNFYGQSKLDGEQVVLQTDKNNIVLRIPVLYGEVEYLDESAVTTLFKLLLSPPEKETPVSDYEIRRPSSVSDIAEILVKLVTLIEQKDRKFDIFGIYQWCGHEPMTKYDMIKTMAEVFGRQDSQIIADKSPSKGAPRPYDTTMKTDRLTELGINVHTDFKSGIEACLKKWATEF